VKIRKLNRRERTEWVLDYYSGGKRVRKWFRTKDLAQAEVDNLKVQRRQCGDDWIELGPDERNELMAVYSEAKRDRVSLRQVWEAFKTGKLDATPLKRRTLAEALDETIAAKRTENRRDRYIESLDNYLRRFIAGRSEMFIDRIGLVEIESWFDGRNEAQSTRKSNLGRISAMFDLCWRRGYVKENPCLRVGNIRIDEKPPVILTPKQAEVLLKACISRTPEFLPYVVLGMFAGVRPEEIEKLSWGDLDIKQGRVRIDSAAAKVRERRLVQLHPTGKAWLKTLNVGPASEPIAPSKSTIKRNRARLCDEAQIEWHQDILRKTAASYLLAFHRNAHDVAQMLGNSARILEKHYKDLVTPEDCKRFWYITPSKASP